MQDSNFFQYSQSEKIENNTDCQNYEFDCISKNENKKLVQNLKQESLTKLGNVTIAQIHHLAMTHCIQKK